MATFTSLQVASGAPVRKQEKGIFSIVGEYTLTATLPSGDVIEMLKSPDGVTVLGLELIHPNISADDGALLFNVGDGADRNRFAESHTANNVGKYVLGSNTNTKLASLPYLYDLSDNDPLHYDTIDLAVIAFAGTGTKVGTLKLVAYCTADYP